MKEFFKEFEAKYGTVHKYEEYGKLCGYEIDSYTALGVNMIIFLDFRDKDLDPTNPQDIVTEFRSYMDDFDEDEMIDMHRQSASYREAFKISDSVEDFRGWVAKMWSGIILLESATNYQKLYKPLDLTRDQNLFSIRKDGEVLGYIEMKDGKIVTEGVIGERTYDNFVELIKGLQGFDIAIDNFFW
jgi:hypothetical protein